MHTITFIVCKIRTERSVGEECRLLYQHGEDFVHECGSGFRLTTEKETVLLHLSGLSPVDSGEYTCECSHTHGTDVLHLIVTVKGDDKNSTSALTMLSYITVIGCGTALTAVSGVVLGLALRKKCCRSSTRSGSSGLSVCATSCSLDKDEPDNLYTSLGQPAASDLWPSMDGLKRWFVLLLPLCVHADSKETVVKTIRRQPDVTPVCASENSGSIVFVTCRISTERHRGKECCLLYVCDEQFDHECDSRFTLTHDNQTVFIHLSTLTPLDSGNYTCECSYQRATHVTHLAVTVEADEEDSSKVISAVTVALCAAAAAFVVTAGITCGHILRRSHPREETDSGTSELRYASPRFLDQDEPYVSLQQPLGDVYHTVSFGRPEAADSDPAHVYAVIHQEADGKEGLHPIYTICETI
uniref:uncharacterized protein LOC124055687 n=1 Tax=Scatophagus argus TaxID=75038 RepID=UPI001ED83FF6|nr:uncharacterized protein LOC124055687 [Scatophagus argus]